MAGRVRAPGFYIMKNDCIFIDKERKLCFSVMAMEEISKKFGSLDKAFDKSELEKDQAEAINTICKMVRILINAEIMRNNKLIDLGLRSGEKEQPFDMTDEDIKMVWKLNDFKRCKVAIVSSMATGYETDYEEEEEEERDLVLEEINAEKNG
jgi:hypothetical protein